MSALPPDWSAEPLIQAQLLAYNAHDVKALLCCYHPEAQHFAYPDRLIAQGHEALAERMASRFAASRPVATLLHRVVMGSVVIDHERIRSESPDGPLVRELVALYEVQAPLAAEGPSSLGRILRARFLFGEEQPETEPAAQALITRG